MDCLLKCLSKAVNVDGDELERKLKFVGRNIVNNLHPPYCYRGYNHIELGVALLDYGYALMYVPSHFEVDNIHAKLFDADINIDEVCNKVKDKCPIVLMDESHACLLHNGVLWNPYPNRPLMKVIDIIIVTKLGIN